MKPSPAMIWGPATLMVTLVSCCSLIGVSIMPLISGPSYKVFITLFTGLAVGSLLGSAIFSLIPQAFALHLSTDKSYLWKSLIIFFGIYLFYCSERIMRIYFDRKARQTEREQEQIALKKNRSGVDLDLRGPNDLALGDGDVPNQSSGLTNRATGSSGISNDKKNHSDNLTEISLAKDNEDKTTTIANNRAVVSDNGDDHQQSEPLNYQDKNNHPHYHHHNHVHNPQEVLSKALKNETPNRSMLPQRDTIAPVAWMIIIGDGLHNFIDGLSIGAAFSESTVLGFSTSVAVIFEEFPHELGDFAVLIASGMTVRQALGFNFLSACTCYLGMILGILLGDLTQSASFIFALAGGMFLYISLVDMMGELSAMLEESKGSTRETSHLLVMQNIGILTGIIITFTLSLFSNG